MASAAFKSSASPAARRNYLRRAVAFAWPHRRGVALILGITLLLATVNAAEPLVLKQVFDGLTSHTPKHALLVGIGCLLAGASFGNWPTAGPTGSPGRPASASITRSWKKPSAESIACP